MATNFEVETMVKLTDHDNEIGSLKHRMDKAERTIDQIHELTTSVKLIAQKQDNIGQKIDSVTDKVTAVSNEVANIKAQPAEKWNKVTSTILTGLVSAIVTAIAAAIIANM